MEGLLNDAIEWLCALFPQETMLSHSFNMRATLALVLISIICGSVGSLVVGNRLAFFSDALAHCAFAGVALGIIIALVLRLVQGKVLTPDELLEWAVPVMIVFGVLTGLAIVFVREKTSQSSDTVIGVFFAGAIGMGAILLKVGSSVMYFPKDEFLFGSLMSINSSHMVALVILVVVTLAMLAWMYNGLVFANFNTSLARSRRIPLRLYHYLFIALLAVVVNLCLSAVGALLISALLVVPAATAVNLCWNMRQLFRWSIGICLFSSVAGQVLSWEIAIPTAGRHSVHPGEGGTIVVLSVLLFFLSMLVGPWLRARPSTAGVIQ